MEKKKSKIKVNSNEPTKKKYSKKQDSDSRKNTDQRGKKQPKKKYSKKKGSDNKKIQTHKETNEKNMIESTHHKHL